MVRWSEGEDFGKLSDIKTDAKRGYDDSKMDQDGNPFATYSAVIEWRHGRKQRGGWPHYRGTVIFVGGKLRVTNFTQTQVLCGFDTVSATISMSSDNYVKNELKM